MLKTLGIINGELFTAVTNSKPDTMRYSEPSENSPAFNEPYKDSLNNDVLYGNVYELNTSSGNDAGYYIPLGKSKFPYQSSEDEELHAICVIKIPHKDPMNTSISTTVIDYDNKLWVNKNFTIKDTNQMLKLVDPIILLDLYRIMGIKCSVNITLE